MAEPYIKLYKKMLDWEWYNNPNTCRVFIHCLLRANWKPCKWQGQEIEKGQFITSLANLANETNLTVDQVRTALRHLVSTGEITSKSQSKFRIITVNNWNEYQADTKQRTKEVPSRPQADPKQVPTDKEIKEEEELKNKKYIYGEYGHVKLKDSERDKLFNEFGESETLEAIKYLDESIEMKGYKYRSHYLALRKWVFDALKKDRDKNGKESSGGQQSLYDKWMNA